MSEYIDRAAAVAISDYAADEHPYEKMGGWENSSEYNEGWNDACDYIRDKLENVTAADVAPVVRCRDCKHYHEGTGWCDKLSYFQLSDGEPCSPAESMDWKTFQEDDFCSYGERKESDNDQQN